MIQYSLICENDHKFEAWFKNANAYDAQAQQGVLECPLCGTSEVNKALMAPAVGKKANQREDVPQKTMALSAGHPEQQEVREALRRLRSKVESEAEYVGTRFAEEARKMAEEPEQRRGIYGEATAEEVTSLIEDDIDFMPLPRLPEEHN
ncbi:hypothetical protein ATL17_2583 [Maritalea mobilis]|uniref:DUF1178 family protein n=1 Tax=Maritalea mobilis TaxID=483324 RepID=A0A4R6VIT7_9HYPH|nr:DUF1178 family protein [Maritalea mobilis]TDQ61486.1 hypothetical protein ATL17_2583 [Maritalea mobilis]